MNEPTRQWLELLATVKNNSKAQEILKYIKELEAKVHQHNYQVSLDGSTMVCECGSWK